jgi:hypothetical protein
MQLGPKVASTKSLPPRERASRASEGLSRVLGGFLSGFPVVCTSGANEFHWLADVVVVMQQQVGLKTGDKPGSCFNNSHKLGRHQEGIRYRASLLSRVSLPFTRDNLRDRFRNG